MFDVKKAQEDAEAELAEERAEKAKTRIKSKLREIAAARKVLGNLNREYEILLEDIGETV